MFPDKRTLAWKFPTWGLRRPIPCLSAERGAPLRRKDHPTPELATIIRNCSVPAWCEDSISQRLPGSPALLPCTRQETLLAPFPRLEKPSPAAAADLLSIQRM